MTDVIRTGPTLLYPKPCEDNNIAIHAKYVGRSSVVNHSHIDASIVFVHGLNGHPRKTWEASTAAIKERKERKEKVKQEGGKENKGKISAMIGKLKYLKLPMLEERSLTGDYHEAIESSITFWPADLLPSVIPNARIWTYGYDADVVRGLFSGQNKNSVLQHGNDLMVKLERHLQSTTV
jgi:hypothetical protein